MAEELERLRVSRYVLCLFNLNLFHGGVLACSEEAIFWDTWGGLGLAATRPIQSRQYLAGVDISHALVFSAPLGAR